MEGPKGLSEDVVSASEKNIQSRLPCLLEGCGEENNKQTTPTYFYAASSTDPSQAVLPFTQ